jgi:hypothetical protein
MCEKNSFKYEVLVIKKEVQVFSKIDCKETVEKKTYIKITPVGNQIDPGAGLYSAEKIQKAFIPASWFSGDLPVQLSCRFHISPGHGQTIALGPDFGKSQTMDNKE